ncbi:class I SAM-dependent methyltransferase [Candidatus Gottesmanbacteria bacterium]|nr:class I SAM-dependent methyltransferase [Candidatus Gottesmanbacteria bacterium]
MKDANCYLCNDKNRWVLFTKKGYRICRCSRCGFIYTNPAPSNVQLEKFYKNFDYKNKNVAELTIRSDAVRSLKKIIRFVGKGRRKILDIGCGRGFFLDEAHKLGWSVHGIDYSKNVIDYATNNLNLNVKRADMFNYDTEELYDVVSLNQVIEHVTEPNRLVKICSRLLKNGGLLYIATPNFGSISAKVSGSDFDHLIPPEHLSYFDKESLTKLLKDNNFSIQYTGSWSYSVDLAGIIKNLLHRNKHSTKISTKRSVDLVGFNSQSRMKKIKYFFFDKLFCRIFYRILNFDSFGIMLDVVAVKK